MASNTIYFNFAVILVCVSVNCYSNIQQKRTQLTYEQGALRHSSLSRFRRQTVGYGGYKNYMQGTAVQPSVVVIPNGVPPLYRGPGSSYVPSTSYGASSSYGGYGANRVPAVVVNMPDENYITPVVNSPYAVPSRRL